jgi:phosphomannomutase
LYLFDVDGTLTPSRQKIDPKFKEWFMRFAEQYPVAFVSGSDSEKTVEQVGQDLFDAVEYSFNCAGNTVYRQGQLIYQSEWQPDDKLMKHLSYELLASKYPHRYGNHIEIRTGMVNFSTVGRDCTVGERISYHIWDREHREREQICARLKAQLPHLTFEIGGNISIDIFPNGSDKAQVLKYLPGQELDFFGDRMLPGGNDYTLSQAILDKEQGRCYNISNWLETERILKQLCPNV